jgi:hypothetical protein
MDTVRHCRSDFTSAGASSLEAYELGQRPARVASYSVWRPLKRITRDPLALLSWKSPGSPFTQDFKKFTYRAKSESQGEYMLEAMMIQKPKAEGDHEWYFVPDQEQNEVLMIKFADTESAWDESISGGCGHGSPLLEGAEDEMPRESIEARILAFW